ncbi:MAG: SDR family NAD(P)-dependent oxidoreductase [Planctomycetota bacterium]
MLRDSHCLVTGGAGFIGSHVAAQLLAEGAHVRVLDNLSTGFESNLDVLRNEDQGNRLTVINGDAADASAVAEAVDGVDYIFHLAAMASVPRSMREPALCHRWTATSTVELLAAGAKAGTKRFILSSTSAAYGDSKYVSKRETDPVAPMSPYAAAKLASENYCAAFGREFKIDTVILRYFNVFGPRQDPASEYSAVIPKFVSLILEGKRPIVFGDGGQSRDFIYVSDVAAANLLAATHDDAPGRILNVGRGESTTLLQLLDELRLLLDRDIAPIHEPARAGDVRQSLADITELESTLGYRPEVNIADGLRASIDYYQAISSHA